MNTPPIIYMADPVTGELIGTSYPDQDPLDTENWLLPAHAYLDVPPVPGEGNVVVRTKNGWSVLADHRGTVYCTSTGVASEHDELGELPEGLTTHPRPSPAHRWLKEQWVIDQQLSAELEQARVNAEALAYLAETDWLIIRRQETGEEVPADVLTKRNAARKVVVR